MLSRSYGRIILQGYTTPEDGKIRSLKRPRQKKNPAISFRWAVFFKDLQHHNDAMIIPFRHQKIVSIIYFNSLRFQFNMGLYFLRVCLTRRLPEYCLLIRVYDTRRRLRCHSRGCDVIKTSGQHPSRGSYIRRRPGLYPSRCYDTEEHRHFILQEVKTRTTGIFLKNLRNFCSPNIAK